MLPAVTAAVLCALAVTAFTLVPASYDDLARDRSAIAAADEAPGSSSDGSGGGDDGQPHACIATFDETQLFLPNGIVPQRVLSGPFGIYVVCG